MILFTIVVAAVIASAIYFYSYWNSSSKEVEESEYPDSLAGGDKEKRKKKSSSDKKSTLPNNKIPKSLLGKVSISATGNKDHRLFFNEIGGHTSPIKGVVFSSNNDFVATFSSEGCVRCMLVSEIGSGAQHELTLHLDEGLEAICFTQNSKRLLTAIHEKLQFYKMIYTTDSKKFELVKESNIGLKKVNSIQLLDVEKWMTIAIAGEMDNKPVVKVYNSKGDLLCCYTQSLKSKDMKSKHPNHHPHHSHMIPSAKKAILASSPDDRFIAISGVGEAEGIANGEVGIFEVNRGNEGAAIGLILKFLLSGHETELTSFSWSANGKRAVTLCKDGSWRLWDTSVRYDDADRPRQFSGAQRLPGSMSPSHIALLKGTTGPIVCCVVGKSLHYCGATTGEEVEVVENAFGGSVMQLVTALNGTAVAVVIDGAKRVSIWKA